MVAQWYHQHFQHNLVASTDEVEIATNWIPPLPLTRSFQACGRNYSGLCKLRLFHTIYLCLSIHCNHFFLFTCLSCDCVAGCTGALTVEGLEGEGEVLAAHQWRQTAHSIWRGVTLKCLDVILAVCRHDNIVLSPSRLLVHHPGWVCQTVNLHVWQARYAGHWRFIRNRSEIRCSHSQNFIQRSSSSLQIKTQTFDPCLLWSFFGDCPCPHIHSWTVWCWCCTLSRTPACWDRSRCQCRCSCVDDPWCRPPAPCTWPLACCRSRLQIRHRWYSWQWGGRSWEDRELRRRWGQNTWNS